MRLLGYPPLAQVRADAERHDERRALGAGQADDRVDVEVVVVVVADDHRVDGGQRLQRHRHLVQPLRAHRLRRRAAADSTPGRRARGSRRPRSAPTSGRTSTPTAASRRRRRARARPAGSARAAWPRRASRSGPQTILPLLLAVQADAGRRVEVDERRRRWKFGDRRATASISAGEAPSAAGAPCSARSTQPPASSDAVPKPKRSAARTTIRRPGTSAAASRCAPPAPRSRPDWTTPCRTVPVCSGHGSS